MSNEQQNSKFEILRIYTKNISLESPNSPQVFKANINPEISIQLSNEAFDIEENTYEITLRVTITAKYDSDEKTMFLAEVEQAGIFVLESFNDEALGHMKGAYCPTILFPYVREVIDSVITRAGFPPVILAPINFDAVYAQRMEQMNKQKEETAGNA